MPTATASTVRKQITAGTPDTIYLLIGEDEIEKSALAHAFEDLVDEGLRAFNVERVHAGDLTTGDRVAAGVGSLVAAARTLPMMSPRRVVIVMQAEYLLAPKRESEAAARAMEELEGVLRQPEAQTTIVFVAGSLDKRGRMYKLLAKQATVVECGVIEDDGDAQQWVRNRVAAAGMQIEPGAAKVLAERGGTDVRRLRNDVDRLLLYALGQKSVTLDDVKEVVGPAALQSDWAITNAIEAGDAREALQQLALMFDAGAAAEKILGQLGWVVRTKLAGNRTAVQPAAEALFRTDLALKRSAGEPRILLERLVVELCARSPASGRRS